MRMQKLLKPALYIMDMLSFKLKIIFSISFLLLILIFPTMDMVSNSYDRIDIYHSQLEGLEYVSRLYRLIGIVQSHRFNVNSYLNGDISKWKMIKEDEERFEMLKNSIKSYDSYHLNILGSNSNFGSGMSKFILLKMDNISRYGYYNGVDIIFEKHNIVIELIMGALLDISKDTKFSISEDLRVNYLADMLQDKLLGIYEQSSQLRVICDIVLNGEDISHERRKILYSISTEIISLKYNLINNSLLTKLPNYQTIQNHTTDLSDRLYRVISLIDDWIIFNGRELSNIEKLKGEIDSAVVSQEELYNIFIETYRSIIDNLIDRDSWAFRELIIGYSIVLLLAIYIYIALYSSIAENLKKLQDASDKISRGRTDINLEIKKEDEIGKALIAFNTMSDKLNKNISFLNGYKLAIDKSSIVSKTDARGVITYANDMFCRVSGYSRGELIGSPHNLVRHPDVPKEFFKNMWNTIKGKKVWKGVIKNRRKNGSSYIVNATIIPILDNRREIIEYVAVRHDITEIERHRRDLLTGLPNRNWLMDDLPKATKPILLYINIDDFSEFNNFYGKRISDRALISLSKILGRRVEGGDLNYIN